VFLLPMTLSMLVAVPTSSTAESMMASEVLWQRALQAQARDDLPGTEHALWGWLTLQSEMRGLPPSFGHFNDKLLSKLQTQGPIRVYGSRMSDRVRVALTDPARVIGRIQVFKRTPHGWRMLSRLQSHAGDRYEYGEVGPLDVGDQIRIEAYMLWPNHEILVRRVHLLPEASILRPSGPRDVLAKTSTRAQNCGQDESCSQKDNLSDVWWTLALGVLALGFAGGAVWQEQRFLSP
jgi:hypothetical protein